MCMFKWIDIDKLKPSDGDRCIIKTDTGQLLDCVYHTEDSVIGNKDKGYKVSFDHGEGFYHKDDFYGFWVPVIKPKKWIPYPLDSE